MAGAGGRVGRKHRDRGPEGGGPGLGCLGCSVLLEGVRMEVRSPRRAGRGMRDRWAPSWAPRCPPFPCGGLGTTDLRGRPLRGRAEFSLGVCIRGAGGPQGHAGRRGEAGSGVRGERGSGAIWEGSLGASGSTVIGSRRGSRRAGRGLFLLSAPLKCNGQVCTLTHTHAHAHSCTRTRVHTHARADAHAHAHAHAYPCRRCARTPPAPAPARPKAGAAGGKRPARLCVRDHPLRGCVKPVSKQPAAWAPGGSSRLPLPGVCAAASAGHSGSFSPNGKSKWGTGAQQPDSRVRLPKGRGARPVPQTLVSLPVRGLGDDGVPGVGDGAAASRTLAARGRKATPVGGRTRRRREGTWDEVVVPGPGRHGGR